MFKHRQILIRSLLVFTAVLVILSAFASYFKLQVLPGHSWDFYGYVPLFDMDHESNLPTWFSSSLLLCCAGLLARRAYTLDPSRSRFRIHWWLLSAGFVYLSVDETAMIHEKIGNIIGRFSTASETFFYPWVVPAIVAVAILSIAYARFLAHLPPRVRFLFIASGALYVGGAVGMEIVTGWFRAGDLSDHTATYAILMHSEETLELLGVLLFLNTLLALPNESRSRPC